MEDNYNLTINTDASFSPKTKRGGYGIWICYRDYRHKVSGPFIGPLEDSTEAELKAVVNAFHIISSWDVEVKRIIVNCDNKMVRDLIDKKFTTINIKYSKLNKLLHEYIEKYPLVYSKKIKGHQRPELAARYYVNNWCDRKAKEGRLEAEQKLGIQTTLEFKSVTPQERESLRVPSYNYLI